MLTRIQVKLELIQVIKVSFAPLVATFGKPLGNLCGDWLPGGTNQLIGELKLSVLPSDLQGGASSWRLNSITSSQRFNQASLCNEASIKNPIGQGVESFQDGECLEIGERGHENSTPRPTNPALCTSSSGCSSVSLIIN